MSAPSYPLYEVLVLKHKRGNHYHYDSDYFDTEAAFLEGLRGMNLSEIVTVRYQGEEIPRNQVEQMIREADHVN